MRVELVERAGDDAIAALRGRRHRHRHRAGHARARCSSPSPRPTRRPPAATAAPAWAWRSRASSSTLMGGEIGADVRAAARAARFHFTVRLPAPETAPRRRAARALTRARPGLSVLVVDDNATNREIVERLPALARRARASSADVRRRRARPSMHAAARAGEPFEVVVLDAQMPEMDGLDLAAAIRQAPSLRATRARDAHVHRRRTAPRARAGGSTRYLTKPVRRARAAGGGRRRRARQRARRRRPAEAGAGRAGARTSAARVLVAEDNDGQPARDRDDARQARLRRRRRRGRPRGARHARPTARTRRCFMDCQMPNVDGYEATAGSARSERDGDAPADHRDDRARDGGRPRALPRRPGMDDYLVQAAAARGARRRARALARRRAGQAPTGADEAASDALDRRGAHAHVPRRLPGHRRPARRRCSLESTPPLLDELRAALDGGDDEALRRAAHKLKGSCQNVGATFMATLCQLAGDAATATHATTLDRARRRVRRRPRQRSAGR